MRYMYKSNDGLLTLIADIRPTTSENRYEFNVISLQSPYYNDIDFWKKYELINGKDDFIELAYNGGDYTWTLQEVDEDPWDEIHIWIDTNPENRDKRLKDFSAIISRKNYDVIRRSFKVMFDNKRIEII